MKRQLYLYLFILSVLITAFTYMYYSKALAFEKNNNSAEIKNYKDSIIQITNQLDDANHFSLEKNENARDYFADYDVRKLAPQIKESLLAFNDNPKGNIYTGQEKLGVQKFIISKIKILNHRWIIAEYSDGQYWGECLLKYFVEKDGKVNFIMMDTYLYPKQQY